MNPIFTSTTTRAAIENSFNMNTISALKPHLLAYKTAVQPTSSNSYQSPTRLHTPHNTITCPQCHKKIEPFTSKTADNFGRKVFKCCNKFIQWADDTTPTQPIQCLKCKKFTYPITCKNGKKTVNFINVARNLSNGRINFNNVIICNNKINLQFKRNSYHFNPLLYAATCATINSCTL